MNQVEENKVRVIGNFANKVSNKLIKKRHIKSLILEYNFPAIIWLERRTYAGKFGRYKVYRTYLYKWDFIVYYYLKGKEPLSMYIIQDKKRNRMYLIDVQNNICWNLRYIYPVRCNIETY
ncbi:MAG TPA: hypothetical protein EYP03_03550 [Aquificae bacterium]|nr:hypothetical protein [Aquificota bacterium]